jgi:hypothetical protein
VENQALGFLVLRKEATKRLCLHALQKGQASKILLLGAIGFGVFLFVIPAYALFVLFATLGLAAVSVWQALRSRDGREKIIRLLIRQRFGSEDALRTVGAGQREEVEKSIEIFSEISVKISEIARKNGRNEDLFKIFSDAERLMTLQLESAVRVGELTRVLKKIDPFRDVPRKTRRIKGDGEVESDQLLQQNIDAIRRDIAESEELVGEIGRKLETLMLQIAQLGKNTSDIVSISEFAQESSENLRRIQTVVEERRKTAEEYIAHTKAFHA